MATRGWSGSRVTSARIVLGRTLPSPCIRCGEPVQPWDTWHAGHRVDKVEHPDGKWAWSNLGVEHASCNLKAGGRTGARRRYLDRRLRAW